VSPPAVAAARARASSSCVCLLVASIIWRTCAKKNERTSQE
jgi:hypothetical protein